MSPVEDFTDDYNQRAKFIADPVTWRELRLDNLADAALVIDYGHHEIHAGSAYSQEIHTTGGTEISLSFKTPAGTKRAHLIGSFTASSACHGQILEGPTWTTNTGTVIAPINHHRGSSNTSMLLEDKTATPAWTAGGILSNVSNISGGTVLFEQYNFAASSPTGAGGGGGGSRLHEYILKPDTAYSIVVTSDDGSIGMQLILDWYEHTDTVPLV